MLLSIICLFLCWDDTWALSGRGLTPLDSASFEKITSKFQATLIKFDIYFPYGTAHDEFVKVAASAVTNPDFLVAEIGVKDYGDKENQDLMERFKLQKEDFPAVLLYFPDGRAPERFIGDMTAASLRRFCRRAAGWPLPGTTARLDGLAERLVAAPEEGRAALLAEAKQSLRDGEAEKEAKYYLLVMERVVADGVAFVEVERKRLQGVMAGKLSESKREQMERRLNVLEAFSLPSPEPVREKLEL